MTIEYAVNRLADKRWPSGWIDDYYEHNGQMIDFYEMPTTRQRKILKDGLDETAVKHEGTKIATAYMRVTDEAREAAIEELRVEWQELADEQCRIYNGRRVV